MPRLFTIFLFLTSYNSFTQVNIINRSLTDSSLNIAYTGMENAIELIGLKNNNSTITFSTTNGTITKQQWDRYILTPTKKGECTITFIEKGITIAKKTFRVDVFTDQLIAGLAGIRDSFATVQEIVANPFLRVESPNSFYKHNYSIRSFVLSMDGAGFEEANPITLLVMLSRPM